MHPTSNIGEEANVLHAVFDFGWIRSGRRSQVGMVEMRVFVCIRSRWWCVVWRGMVWCGVVAVKSLPHFCGRLETFGGKVDRHRFSLRSTGRGTHYILGGYECKQGNFFTVLVEPRTAT